VVASEPIAKDTFADQPAPAPSRWLNPNRLTLIEACADLSNV
jgi:hypothetical protein